MFVAPGQCDVRLRCRSVSVFQKWMCADVVVGVMGHSARNYEGDGVWYVVGGPCRSTPFPFPLSTLSQHVGTYLECSGMSIEPRNYLDGSTSRYRSAHLCTESSAEGVTCRTHTGVSRRWRRLHDVYRTISSSLIVFLAMGVP